MDGFVDMIQQFAKCHKHSEYYHNKIERLLRNYRNAERIATRRQKFVRDFNVNLVGIFIY